jgi:hypothetical protein
LMQQHKHSRQHYLAGWERVHNGPLCVWLLDWRKDMMSQGLTE